MLDNATLKQIFEAKYDRQKWNEITKEIFAAELFRSPKNLDLKKNEWEAKGYELGSFETLEGRLVGIFEIDVPVKAKLQHNRKGLKDLLKNEVYRDIVDAALLVFTQGDKWRFSYVSQIRVYNNVTGAREIRATDPKRYTYLMGKGERCKTAADRFAGIQKQENLFKKGVTLEALNEAFNVEKMSKAFFDEYRKHYGAFTSFLTGYDENNKKTGTASGFLNAFKDTDKAKEAHDFVKKMLGRIVFLYFLEKKGWLGVPEDKNWGDGDDYFLSNLYRHCKEKGSFYSDVLVPLFFDTLNTHREDDLFRINAGIFTKAGYNEVKIPYLNGGLFEKDSANTLLLVFPQKLFNDLFTFFDQYNFTVYEDSPDEHTVAVDPEMLGHIFENLLEDNKDKGAYYTPKEIVHYMCHESLIEYLFTKLDSSVEHDDIERFIKLQETGGVSGHTEEILQALHDLKVCDPAIGSGAFPMGILMEVLHAVETLYYLSPDVAENIWPLKKGWNPALVKATIIQKSIYGVDIEQGAVDIARLRFWLSLVVDEEKPQPLPNLDYKIVVGNSLVSKFEDQIVDIDWNLTIAGAVTDEVKAIRKQQKIVQEKLKYLFDKQNQFFNYDGNKVLLKEEIRLLKIEVLVEQLQLNIAKNNLNSTQVKLFDQGQSKSKKNVDNLTVKMALEFAIIKLNRLKNSPNLPLHFFDWKFDFPEAMNDQVAKVVGFDIVIANPPYVEFKNLNKEYKNELEKKYTCATGKYDLYIPFLELPNHLLHKDGVMVYICPTRFMHRDYGKATREFLSNNNTINSILDFGDGQIFENAMTYTGIFSFSKTASNNYTFRYRKFTKKDSLKVFDEIQFSTINSGKINSAPWYFDNNENTLIDKIRAGTVTLESVLEGIYQGMATGKDSVFIIDNQTIIDYKIEKKVLHKILKGKDVGPYNIKWSEKYLIYPYNKDGEVMEEKILKTEYPNLYAYLKDKRDDLKGREYFDKSSKKWYELWNQRNLNKYHKEKLVTLDTARTNSFAFDDENMLGTTTVYSLVPTNDINVKYLLGLLNSSLMSYYHAKNTIPQAGGFFRYQALFIKDLPIKLDNKYFSKIENKVNLILQLFRDDSANKAKRVYKEIDLLVYKLYDLTYEEACVIEGNMDWMKIVDYDELK